MQRRRITVSFSFWSAPLVEWGLLGLVIAALMGVFMYQYRSLQAQAEYALVQSTLGSLRTSLLLDFIQTAVQGKAVAESANAPNPFKVLQELPPNYAGEVPRNRVDEVSEGNWLFDPDCPCAGYRPLYPQWLQNAGKPPVLWFRVVTDKGPAQLVPMRVYRWQGQVIR